MSPRAPHQAHRVRVDRVESEVLERDVQLLGCVHGGQHGRVALGDVRELVGQQELAVRAAARAALSGVVPQAAVRRTRAEVANRVVQHPAAGRVDRGTERLERAALDEPRVLLEAEVQLRRAVPRDVRAVLRRLGRGVDVLQRLVRLICEHHARVAGDVLAHEGRHNPALRVGTAAGRGVRHDADRLAAEVLSRVESGRRRGCRRRGRHGSSRWRRLGRLRPAVRRARGRRRVILDHRLRRCWRRLRHRRVGRRRRRSRPWRGCGVFGAARGNHDHHGHANDDSGEPSVRSNTHLSSSLIRHPFRRWNE